MGKRKYGDSHVENFISKLLQIKFNTGEMNVDENLP